ncbi:RHG06 protein, partial [Polyodon spathula]|nr:RHG06 protein [Polyodon spathula]
MSLLETDPDVVDYLLRRKASQSSIPDLMRSDGPFTLGERHSSTDSKASSGEVSPYDNNSPVLSERLLFQKKEDISPSLDKLFKVPEQYVLVGHLKSKSKDLSPGQWAGKDISDDHTDIWGAWHSTLKPGSRDQGMTGSPGNMHECSSSQDVSYPSQGSLTSEWLEGHDSTSLPVDNGKQPVRRTQTTAGVQECRSHPPVARACSSSQVEGRRKHFQLSSDNLYSKPEGHSASSSAEDIPQRTLNPACLLQSKPKPGYTKHWDINKNESRPPPPYPGPSRQSSAGTQQQQQQQPVSPALQAVKRLPKYEKSPTLIEASFLKVASTEQPKLNAEQMPPVSNNKVNKAYSSQTGSQNNRNIGEQDWQEWQRERWQIWELLSADNADSLPETLV